MMNTFSILLDIEDSPVASLTSGIADMVRKNPDMIMMLKKIIDYVPGAKAMAEKMELEALNRIRRYSPELYLREVPAALAVYTKLGLTNLAATVADDILARS
jgi:hypothetical protein